MGYHRNSEERSNQAKGKTGLIAGLQYLWLHLRKPCINFFIAVNLLLIVTWLHHQVYPSPLLKNMTKHYSAYFFSIGLNQYWDMFGPDPCRSNFFFEAEVVFKDGSKKTWELPYVGKMRLYERLGKARYTEWISRFESYTDIFRDVSKYAARHYHTDAGNPPVAVTWIQYYLPVPDPVPGDYQFLSGNPPERMHYLSQKIVSYKIAPEDLI